MKIVQRAFCTNFVMTGHREKRSAVHWRKKERKRAGQVDFSLDMQVSQDTSPLG